MRTTIIALATTSTLALGLATTAFAADMPARMPAKAPPVLYTAPFSWTGFYAGVNAGWGWTSGSGTIALGGPAGPYSGSGNGFLGGGQLGYNWQSGAAVFGLETDFQGSTGRGSVNGNAGAAVINATAKAPYFGTIRGRLGYAFDRSLLYITGGGAYGQSTLNGTVSTTGPFSSSATYWAWTAGAGYEAMLWDRWSAKIEYLYVGTPSKSPVPPGTTAMSGNGHTNLVRVGLNYHF
jgi:outer membrane immunogenic protein